MDNLVDKCFCHHDVKMLTGMGLKSPSLVKDTEKNAMHDAAEKLLMKVGGIKGNAIKKGQKYIADDADMTMNLLRVFMGVMKPKKNRNNKIGSSGEYGNLVIHLPGLFTEGILRAYDQGKKVMDVNVDQDTIDLLTKRYDAKKNYSGLSRQVFNKLNQINENSEIESDDEPEEEPDEESVEGVDTMTPFYKALLKNLGEEEPEERYNDGKPESEFFAECEEIESEDGEFDDEPNDVTELLKRLETLCGDILDGDDSIETQNKFSTIVNQLHGRDVISDSQMEQLHERYCR